MIWVLDQTDISDIKYKISIRLTAAYLWENGYLFSNSVEWRLGRVPTKWGKLLYIKKQSESKFHKKYFQNKRIYKVFKIKT